MNLKNKNIILAVTGSIAAYKSLFLTRLLVKAGAQVKVVMTDASKAFVSPLSFSTLSKNPVFSEIINGEAWNNHVELGLWADIMLIAPCTAASLSKLAHGLSDNLLTAVYLSAKCPVMIAPAMDRDMWLHPANQKNIQLLESYGNLIIPVGKGELASGLEGEGRMAEPEDIIELLNKHFAKTEDLSGYKVMITAGPTFEKIDPVRFIGNHSSGKMGIALAQECADRGAVVELILGPSKLDIVHANVKIKRVVSADEMLKAAKTAFRRSDISIFAAAVSDYKPKVAATEKIKKKNPSIKFELIKTTDIASELGKIKKAKQINIGFALETNNEELNAVSKLNKKNFDFIVLNSLRDKGAGFMSNTNKITILDNTGEKISFSLKPKQQVAGDIIDYLVENKL